MTNSIVPYDDTPQEGDGNSSPEGSSGTNTSQRRRKRRPRIYTSTDCLEMLSQIPGMIKLKILTPGEANAIRPTLQAILAEHRAEHRSSGGQQAVPKVVLDMARERPELQTWLEPMLSDDDIATLVGEGGGDD